MQTDLHPEMQSLVDRGYVIDEWDIWQQGNCGIYAAALIRHDPTLRLGTLVDRYFDEDDQCEYDHPVHFFAHDDQFAYDSAGRHSLPYVGVSLEQTYLCSTDEQAIWYSDEVPVDDKYLGDVWIKDHLDAALTHAIRNNIIGQA